MKSIMKTMIFDFDEKNIDKISQLLLSDKVGAIPCDTIYGFCARSNIQTKEKIYELKKRPQNKNLITLTNKEYLSRSSLIVPKVLYDIWPAPLTAILKNKDSDLTVAVRIPNDSFILSLIDRVGPIWSTSVNISGQPSLNNFEDINSVFDNEVDFIVKKEIKGEAIASTLVDFSSDEVKILRQGAFDIKPYLI